MARVKASKERLADFCRRHNIRRLSIFGSALRKDFKPKSDVDILVEFKKDKTPSLLQMVRMEAELNKLYKNRKIDLRTPEELSRYFRDKVISASEVQYAGR